MKFELQLTTPGVKFRNGMVFFLSLVLPWVAVAHSGHEAGNGGNTIYCATGDILPNHQRRILLDYYEAVLRWGFHSSMDEIPGDYQAKVQVVLNRLRLLDPTRASRYQLASTNFLKDAKFLADVQLSPTQDSFHFGIPSQCQLVQTVIQKEPEFPNDRVFNISQDVWNSLDDSSKAGLELHEIILRDFLKAGEEDSQSTRYFNAWIASKEFVNADSAEYGTQMKRIRASSLDTPIELGRVQEAIQKVLVGRTTYRETRDERNQTQTVSRDVRKFTSFGTVFASGRQLYFETTDVTEVSTWSLDRGMNRVGQSKNSKRKLVTRYAITQSKSTGQTLGYSVVVSDSEVNSTRGLSIGNLTVRSDGSILWEAHTAAYGDYESANGLVPGVSFLREIWSLSGGRLMRDSRIDVYEVNPATLDKADLISHFELHGSQIDLPFMEH